MQIIPEKIKINETAIGTQSEKIQTSKTNIENMHKELMEVTHKLDSGMAGEIKRYYVIAGECTELSINKVNDRLVKVADEITVFANAIKILDEEAAYMAGGSIDE